MLAALLLATLVAAPAETPRTIQVTGTAEVTVVPDICYLSFTVTATHKTSAARAYKDNSAKMAAVIAAIRALDIPEKDLSTSSLTITPQYRWDSDDERRYFEGYEVNNSLAVELRDMAKVSPVLDAAVDAGATIVTGVNFTVENPKKYLVEARVEAVKAAKAKAEAMAGAAGAQLGPVQAIYEHEPGNYNRYFAQTANVAFDRSGNAGSSGDAITPGDVRLSQSVNVTFELR